MLLNWNSSNYIYVCQYVLWHTTSSTFQMVYYMGFLGSYLLFCKKCAISHGSERVKLHWNKEILESSHPNHESLQPLVPHVQALTRRTNSSGDENEQGHVTLTRPTSRSLQPKSLRVSVPLVFNFDRLREFLLSYVLQPEFRTYLQCLLDTVFPFHRSRYLT